MTGHQAEQIAFFLLRVVAALLFIQVGGLKLFGWFGGIPPGAWTPCCDARMVVEGDDPYLLTSCPETQV